MPVEDFAEHNVDEDALCEEANKEGHEDGNEQRPLLVDGAEHARYR